MTSNLRRVKSQPTRMDRCNLMIQVIHLLDLAGAFVDLDIESEPSVNLCVAKNDDDDNRIRFGLTFCSYI